MIFGKQRKRIFKYPNRLIKLYFSIGSVLLFVFFIIYTNMVLSSFKYEAEIVPNLFARFFTYSTEEDWESLLSQYVFEEIIVEIDYPIILTDSKKTPLYWKNIEIKEGVTFSELTLEEQEYVLRILKKMESDRNVIPLYYSTENDSVINFAFYSESKAMRRLRMMPYVEALFVLLFVLFGVYAIFFLKRNEKDILWVGMAKEMAHQLGTPISSLLGWIDVLNSRIEKNNQDTEMTKLLAYMENDANQLRKVAHRFGKIGSEIELKPVKLHDVIEESVLYFKHRLPQITYKIDIILISKIQDIKVNVDPDLIKWAVENLIKNAIDAMQKKGGSIIVIAFQENKKTHIIVQDEGKGIPKSMQSKIFDPGVSTKSRGWGLGLSLARRIVVDYHHGKIQVIHSVIDEGSTIEITIPEN
jgi:hypothetical protein